MWAVRGADQHGSPAGTGDAGRAGLVIYFFLKSVGRAARLVARGSLDRFRRSRRQPAAKTPN